MKVDYLHEGSFGTKEMNVVPNKYTGNVYIGGPDVTHSIERTEIKLRYWPLLWSLARKILVMPI